LPRLGPDLDDEDGDNEVHSPSSYLNSNQDENEGDTANANHEDDANEEYEGNDEQALVDTLLASQVRRGHSPNKLPSGHFVITVVNEVGDPMQPPVLVNAWKTSVGKHVRENAPLTYRFWKGKTHEEKYIIPDSMKQNLWDTLMAKFELPRDCNTGLVRNKTLTNLGWSFINIKSRMWSQYGQKDKMPDWDKYPLLKSYWSGFKKYKQSEEATKMSQENKVNSKKKVLHHTTGSCGYAGKEETWQEQEEKTIQLGATPTTANWTERSKRFILGHGAVLTTKGKLEFKTDKVKEMAEMIEKAHTESEEGTFVPSRDMDELNYALQSKEHPRRTRGYGNRPWKHALKSMADSYGKKRKLDELFEEKIQEKV
jgi:hypothetical protein